MVDTAVGSAVVRRGRHVDAEAVRDELITFGEALRGDGLDAAIELGYRIVGRLGVLGMMGAENAATEAQEILDASLRALTRQQVELYEGATLDQEILDSVVLELERAVELLS